jgi:hypothetical protein
MQGFVTIKMMEKFGMTFSKNYLGSVSEFFQNGNESTFRQNTGNSFTKSAE